MLVNTRKRVATAWHRNHGPLLLHHVIRATLIPDVALPREIEGEAISVRAARIVTALETGASREDLAPVGLERLAFQRPAAGRGPAEQTLGGLVVARGRGRGGENQCVGEEPGQEQARKGWGKREPGIRRKL